jgi:hypothetical protein
LAVTVKVPAGYLLVSTDVIADPEVSATLAMVSPAAVKVHSAARNSDSIRDGDDQSDWSANGKLVGAERERDGE